MEIGSLMHMPRGLPTQLYDISINKYTVLEEMKSTWGELKQRVGERNCRGIFSELAGRSVDAYGAC